MKDPHNILTSDLFQPSCEVLAARRKQLKRIRLGNRPNKADSFTDDMIDTMWEKDVLGSHTPKSLQNTLIYFFTMRFGFRGSHESKQLAWGRGGGCDAAQK